MGVNGWSDHELMRQSWVFGVNRGDTFGPDELVGRYLAEPMLTSSLPNGSSRFILDGLYGVYICMYIYPLPLTGSRGRARQHDIADGLRSLTRKGKISQNVGV